MLYAVNEPGVARVELQGYWHEDLYAIKEPATCGNSSIAQMGVTETGEALGYYEGIGRAEVAPYEIPHVDAQYFSAPRGAMLDNLYSLASSTDPNSVVLDNLYSLASSTDPNTGLGEVSI